MPRNALSLSQRLTLMALIAALCLRIFQVVCSHLWLPLNDTLELVHDDAFYYLQIAWNLASGAGSTFGGINATNGYQWLWQMVTAAAAWLLSPSRLQFFQLLTFSGYLCMGWLCLRLALRGDARDRLFHAALVAGLLAAAYAFREVFWHGMETTLLLLLLPTFVAWLEGRLRHSTSILITAALLPLVRLDALALVASAYLVMLLRGELTLSRQQWLPRFGPGFAATLTVVIYAGANQLLYGIPVPVSGLAKAMDAPRFANLGIIWYYLNAATGIALGLLLLAELAVRGKPDSPDTFRRSIVVLALATLIQYAYYACLSGWPLWPWYLYLQAAWVAVIYARLFLLLPWLAVRRPYRLPWRPALVTLVVVAIAGVGAIRTNVVRPLLALALNTACDHIQVCITPPASRQSYPAANLALLRAADSELRGHTLAMGDRAGSLGYWMPANTRLLQLEGLVEDTAFLKARLDGSAEAYMAAHGVDRFIVDREHYLSIGQGDDRLTVIPEPVQGRVSNRGAFPLCFPDGALLRQAVSGEFSHQRLYDFGKRRPCPLEAWQAMWSFERGPRGLRQLAVTSEYDAGASLFARLEVWDRSRLPVPAAPSNMSQGKL